MGKLDQFIKEVFAEETKAATHAGLSFEVPPETPTTEVSADGLLRLVDARKVGTLPYPWRLAQAPELVLEFKMQGDKIDRYQVERALLRRQARQCLLARQRPEDPTQLPLWVVTAYLPAWLRQERLLEEAAPGCYRLKPAAYEVYWIASNELPLEPELIPFLVTRTGRALVELAKWLLDTKPDLGEELLEVVPMTDNQLDEVMEALQEPDEAERIRRRRRLAQALAEGTGLAAELREEGEVLVLRSLLERRLSRPLSQVEQSALVEKLQKLGLDRLSAVVLELSPKDLAAWLVAPGLV